MKPKARIIKDEQLKTLMQKIREICGSGVQITFTTTTKAQRFHSLFNPSADDEPDDDEPSEPASEFEYPGKNIKRSIKRKSKIEYYKPEKPEDYIG